MIPLIAEMKGPEIFLGVICFPSLRVAALVSTAVVRGTSINGPCRIFSLARHEPTPIMPMTIFRCFANLRPSDSYQTVSVLCTTCRSKIFKYKKKNGTKSGLVKLYLERIVSDPYNIIPNLASITVQYNMDEFLHGSESCNSASLKAKVDSSYGSDSNSDGDKISLRNGDSACDNANGNAQVVCCPKCGSQCGRISTLAGHRIIKCIGGKLRIK